MADWLSQAIPMEQQPPSWMAGAVPLSPAADKYKQAALDEQAQMRKLGLDDGTGYKNMVLHGATMGASNDVLAALDTPVQMLTHGTLNPAEAWKYALAKQEVAHDTSKQETGIPGALAEGVAGIGTGTGLASKGLTFVKEGQGLLGRAAATAADGGIYGGVNGFFDNGNSLGGAAQGAATGAALGGAIPLVTAAGGAALAPITSNIRARINPEQSASMRLAAALENSGQSQAGVQGKIADATASGQDQYALMDALGQRGQRAASSVVRAGEGGEGLANFLQNRQSGQPDRIVNILDDALGTNGQTAKQASTGLMQQAATDARPLYQQAEAVKPVWSDRAQQFYDDPITQSGLARGMEIQRLEALANGTKYNPHDLAVTGFDDNGNIISKVPNMRSIDAVKKGFDAMLEDYRDGTTGRLMLDQKGRAIDAVRRSFLGEVDSMNPVYAEARKAWAGPASIDSAIDLGQNAAQRGRAADNIGVLNSLTQPQQQGFRHGYADILSGKIERNAGPSTNSTRPLTSPKAAQELEALSLYQGPNMPGAPNQLAQRVGREQDMFNTYQRAMTGSRTADNLADGEAQQVDPHMIADLLQGRFMAAGAKAVRSAGNKLTGFTPDVRDAYGRMLMSKGEDVPLLLQQVNNDATRRQALAAALMQGGAVGAGNLSGGYLLAK
jgi:hypothetical protein